MRQYGGQLLPHPTTYIVYVDFTLSYNPKPSISCIYFGFHMIMFKLTKGLGFDQGPELEK